MYRIIFLLLVFPVLAQAQINQIGLNGQKQGLWQKKQANGSLLYEGHFKDGKPVGEWKRYHQGGQLKALMFYSGDTAQTQIFDIWRKKVAEGVFVNQKKEGLWKIFKENRVVADEEYKLGVKSGVSHKYYETGELMEEKQWLDNKEDGDYQVFYKNGQPYMQCKMKQGLRHGLFLVNFDSGAHETTGAYQNGLRHGEWKYYNKEGGLLYTLFYDNGQILNPAVRDSVDNLIMKQLEQNKGAIPDPEKYMEDPSEYMIKNKIRF